MTSGGYVHTGRIDSRRLCACCEARIKYGDPKPNDTWAGRLRLSEEQVNLLLVAASEFDEAGPGSSVEFIDWISLTATAREAGVAPDHDGGKARLEHGGFGRAYQHRHPFPIPLAELPPKVRAG